MGLGSSAFRGHQEYKSEREVWIAVAKPSHHKETLDFHSEFHLSSCSRTAVNREREEMEVRLQESVRHLLWSRSDAQARAAYLLAILSCCIFSFKSMKGRSHGSSVHDLLQAEVQVERRILEDFGG
jgi:hypothetical protein